MRTKDQKRQSPALEQDNEKRRDRNLKFAATKYRGSPLYCRNKRELTMNDENLEKTYLIEFSTVSFFLW
jgi:hypothetical protein